MKIIKIVLILALLTLVILQFFPPEPNTASPGHASEFFAETNPPEEVRVILETSCFDCHSDHTEYPWYNRIVPVSYWMADHIRHGKGELNFSNWPSYTDSRKAHKMEEIGDEVGKGKMPLEEYTWTHEGANLTEDQREAVMAWARKTRALYQLGALPE